MRMHGVGTGPSFALCLSAGVLLAASLVARLPLPSQKVYAAPAGARQAIAPGDTPARLRADAVFAPLSRGDAPGCSAAVSRHGTLVYARGFGVANLEYAVPITPASVFHVASVSKQFTAMSILLLAQQGKLSLDDDVRRHLSEWVALRERVTIRQLLTHTSGLRDVFLLTEMSTPGDPGVSTADRLVSLLSRQGRLNFPAGSEFQYNNGGYLLLAEIVERVSGQTLAAFARTRIFEPLQMTATFFHDDASMVVRHRATGYVRRGNRFRIALGVDSLVGNAGLFTTPRDLLRWLEIFVEPRLVSSALLRSMEAPTPLRGGGSSPYGFGLWIAQHRGRRTFGHGGGDPGASAYTLRFPDDGLSVAVACNDDEIDSLASALDLADIFLGTRDTANARSVAPPVVALSTEELSRHEGLYYNRATKSLLRMYVRGGVLMGSAGAGTDGGWTVAATSATRFLIPNTPIVLEFLPDSAGRAQALRIVGETPSAVTLERLSSEFRPPPGALMALSGRYANEELDVVYTLAAQDRELTLQIPNRRRLVMQPIFHDGFVASYLGVLIFTRNASGAVTGFTSHTPGVRAIRFERVSEQGGAEP